MRKKTFQLTSNSKFGITAVVVLIFILFIARVIIIKSSGSRKPDTTVAPTASFAETYSAHGSKTGKEKLVPVIKNNGRDFVKEAEKALDASDSEKLKNIIAAWIKNNPDMAIQWVKQIPQDSKYRNCALCDLTIAMVRVDVGGALQLLEELPPDWREIADSQLATAWAEKDPDAAFQWAQALPAQERSGVLAGIVLELGKKDIGMVTKWLQEITSIPDRQHILETLTSKLAKTDPNSAIRWLRELPDEIYPTDISLRHKTKNDMLYLVVSGLAMQDPDAAAKVVLEMLLPEGMIKRKALDQWGGKDTEAALFSLADKWVGKDPEAAAKYLEVQKLISDNDESLIIIRSMAFIWGRKDPQAAKKWVENLPIAKSRKDNILGFFQ